MKLTILSDAEQKEEAVRAIVTAHHEMDAIHYATGLNGHGLNAILRRNKACEWLSLCT